MAGNHAGGLKAAKRNKERDPDFYRKIGSIGGKKSGTGGFYNSHDRAKKAGSIGGKRSKRGFHFLRVNEDGDYVYETIGTKEIVIFEGEK